MEKRSQRRGGRGSGNRLGGHARFEFVDAHLQPRNHSHQHLTLFLVGMRTLDYGRSGHRRIVGQIRTHDVAADIVSGLKKGQLLDHILELAHIAGPAVTPHDKPRLLGERNLRQAPAFGKVCRKLAGEQPDVAATVAQRRNGNLDGREAVVKVLTEAPLLHGTEHVDVGGGNHADIGFLNRRRADFKKFAGFEHAQQASLGRERQFGYLIKENRAAVGFLKIALAGSNSAGERAFLVAEQFGVNRSLGNGAAVHGNVFGMLARGIGMDDFREKLLAGTTLAGDEHRQVDRRHAQGALNRTDKRGSVADDAEPLLGLQHLGRLARHGHHFHLRIE